MIGSNITGRLLNAKRVRYAGQTCLMGEIYEDIHGRFHDGMLIRTSPITSEDGPVICTANSIYEVEGWAE